MVASHWQRQNIYFKQIVWGVSIGLSLVLLIIFLLLGFEATVAGEFFIIFFFATRILLAFILKNRYANSMVRILKFNYEELEREFRLVFKDKVIRYHRKMDEDTYSYEFPGHNLRMIVEPYWLFMDQSQKSATKVTLRELNANNEAFGNMVADSINEMAARLTENPAKA
ncbi:MAG: hypothetical protein KC445_15350 [Anaerolineales bacterium]|nr:hypothetical protein [Anaerolineales bacterium]